MRSGTAAKLQTRRISSESPLSSRPVLAVRRVTNQCKLLCAPGISSPRPRVDRQARAHLRHRCCRAARCSGSTPVNHRPGAGFRNSVVVRRPRPRELTCRSLQPACVGRRQWLGPSARPSRIRYLLERLHLVGQRVPIGVRSDAEREPRHWPRWYCRRTRSARVATGCLLR